MKAGTSSAEIVGTSTSATSWPSSSSSAAASRAASTQAGSVGMPSGASAISPIRRRPALGAELLGERARPAASALFQARGSGPAVTSRTAAASATVRVTTPSTTAPIQVWARRGTRPRLDLRPTRPQ